MKRALYVLAAVTIGVIVAIITAAALMARIPDCGEDCASAALEAFAACMMSALVLFGGSALILSHREIPSLRRSLGAAIVLIVVFLLPAFHYFFYRP